MSVCKHWFWHETYRPLKPPPRPPLGPPRPMPLPLKPPPLDGGPDGAPESPAWFESPFASPILSWKNDERSVKNPRELRVLLIVFKVKLFCGNVPASKTHLQGACLTLPVYRDGYEWAANLLLHSYIIY